MLLAWEFLWMLDWPQMMLKQFSLSLQKYFAHRLCLHGKCPPKSIAAERSFSMLKTYSLMIGTLSLKNLKLFTILLLNHPINSCRFSRKIKNPFFKDKYIFNLSHNVHCFLEPSAIFQVTFLCRFCKNHSGLDAKKSSRWFWILFKLAKFFPQVSVLSTKTNSNLKAPY